MNRKNKLIAVTTISFSVGVLAICAIANAGDKLFNNSLIVVRGAEHICSGNHYTGQVWGDATGKGKNLSGFHEYWHCCVCDAHYFRIKDIKDYDKANWKDNGKTNYYAPKTSSDVGYYTDDRVRFGGGYATGDKGLYFTNHLEEGTIVVDGVRDDLYDNAEKYAFNTTPMWGDPGVTCNTTATMETLWQNKLLYILITVNDETHCERNFDTATGDFWSNDSIDLRIDTLHSDQYASSSWDGKQGGSYRGGYACEARFAVAGGFDKGAYVGDSKGGDYDWFFYLSNLCRYDGVTKIISKYNETAKTYTYEYVINLGTATAINSFGEIGISAKIYDKSFKSDGSIQQDGILTFEGINDAEDYLRNYSNFRLVDWAK